MAINSLDLRVKPIPKLNTSPNTSKTGSGNVTSCRLLKIDFATEGSVCSTSSKRGRNKNADSKSPYLNGDNVASRANEKTFVHKKGAEFFSSFPLAVNIYKANSDDFKVSKKTTKKAKKSVLTLPNNPAPMPQTCTVSDMNDSEYFNQDENTTTLKKRNVPRGRKFRPKGKEYEFYDRDARYCSQMNLDCSSTDMIQNHNCDGRNGQSDRGYKLQTEEKTDPHDVWAVLRNINKFQFRPSPPMSEDSFITPKKKKGSKRRNNRKDMRIVETCRTEEFAYISSYEVDNRSPRSFSKSSSFDRITVIDKQDEFSALCKEFEKVLKTKDDVKDAKNKHRIQNGRRNIRNAFKNNINNTKSLAQKPNNSQDIGLILKEQSRDSYKDTLYTNKNNFQENRDNHAHKHYKLEFDNPVKCVKKTDNQFENVGSCEEEKADNELIYSADSESSKAFLTSKIVYNPVKRKSEKPSSKECHQQINGITKVVVSKGPLSVPPKKPEPPKRQAVIPAAKQPVPKPTKNTVIPKLTQTDIKRRLAKLKFPIVVLGKDQLSSSLEVINIDHPQFNGLNDHIWPFMLDWDHSNGDRRQTLKAENNDKSKKRKNGPEFVKSNMVQKVNKELITSKFLKTDRKLFTESRNKKSLEQKRVLPLPGLNNESNTKPKSIRQFKDIMLKLLYKKSMQNFVSENIETGGNNKVIMKSPNKSTNIKVDASTDTDYRTNFKNVPKYMSKPNAKLNRQVPATKQPWAKGRWASDFIDNVIRKIKSGVYYTHECMLPKYMKQGLEYKEAEAQTVPTDNAANQTLQSISKITIRKKTDPIIEIPGFDNDTQPVLEIKTMNTNEITVKHPVTNILIHFDVTMPNESTLNLKRSTSLIPLDDTQTHTKVFKCKTSIINAMLPAELCTILPQMMWNIVESGQVVALPLVPIENTPTQLSTITEIARWESPEPYNHCIFPHAQLEHQFLQCANNGQIRKNIFPKLRLLTKLEVKYDRRMVQELLPYTSKWPLFDCVAQPAPALKNSVVYCSLAKEPVNPINTYMALQPYSTSGRSLVPAYRRFDLSSFLRSIIHFETERTPLCSRVINYFFDKKITINLSTANSQDLQDSICVNINSLIWNTNCEQMVMVSRQTVNTITKCLPKIMKCVEPKDASPKNTQKYTKASGNKKSFIKLYHKCKSTSNISGEKTSTALAKITNLDEFFQALGTSKLLTGVFDNQYRHKILSSLKEMKNWIKDINPTQALLVLLLVNKKDTANLVRFRPVLLQGIAVNRITRATELDMEIEVIEREHLNRLHQYEGISYLSASVESKDNLLEELCWIAKNTASDYQRTFDESSEKLLKSLLEKRKKLNPSYLRVMARYVGLGLLKSPIKK